MDIKELREKLSIYEVSSDYNEEIARELFSRVNAFAELEDYTLHTPDDFYSLYKCGDYIVMTEATMKEIVEEVITSIQGTLPESLQKCFDWSRAVQECMNDIHVLGEVYSQVQELDQRFDTTFNMIQKEILVEGNKTFYIVTIK